MVTTVQRILVLAAVVVFVAIGAFFASVGRSAADQYASVGAFFLALLTAGISLLTWTRSRRRRDDPPDPDRPGSITINGSDVAVQTGARSRMKIKKTYHPAPKPPADRPERG